MDTRADLSPLYGTGGSCRIPQRQVPLELEPPSPKARDPALRLKYQEEHMRRGEVWWAEFDERRPVVLLSGEDPSGFQAMQVVAPADADISGLGTEVAVGLH